MLSGGDHSLSAGEDQGTHYVTDYYRNDFFKLFVHGLRLGKKGQRLTAPRQRLQLPARRTTAKKDAKKDAKKVAKAEPKKADAPKAAAKASSCGEALDAYGKFVDEYVAALEAASKSNPATAMMKVAPLMQKAQAAAAKLDKAKLEGDRLAAYATKPMTKMSQVASRLAAAAPGGAPKAATPGCSRSDEEGRWSSSLHAEVPLHRKDPAKKAQCAMACNK